jgi:vacuolar protein sorting-associated protein 13A/C
MAKTLIVNTLVEHLGQFVDGISQENFHLGVFSGTIELNNLQLKSSSLGIIPFLCQIWCNRCSTTFSLSFLALLLIHFFLKIDKLNLPVRVTRGHLSSLQVKIPWTALGSKPVQVKLQGIFLQAEPVDIVKLSTEELRKENFLLKRSLLKQAEDVVIESLKQTQTEGDFSENASYLQLLVAKIVANIEILVEDVHIRYLLTHSLAHLLTYLLTHSLIKGTRTVKQLLVNVLHLV